METKRARAAQPDMGKKPRDSAEGWLSMTPKGAGFIASDGMRGRRAPLGPSDGHGGGGEVNLIPAQVHQLGRSEAVSEGHEDHAASR